MLRTRFYNATHCPLSDAPPCRSWKPVRYILRMRPALRRVILTCGMPESAITAREAGLGIAVKEKRHAGVDYTTPGSQA